MIVALAMLLVIGALLHVALIPFTPALASRALAGAVVMGSLAIMMLSVVVAGLASIPALAASLLLGLGVIAVRNAANRIQSLAPVLASIPDMSEGSKSILNVLPIFVTLASLLPYLPNAITGAIGSLIVLAALNRMLINYMIASALMQRVIPVTEVQVQTVESLIPIFAACGALTALAAGATAGALLSAVALPIIGIMFNNMRNIDVSGIPTFDGSVVSVQSLNRLFAAINSLQIPNVIQLTALAARLKLFEVLAPGFMSLGRVVTALGSIPESTTIQALENVDNINLLTRRLRDINVDSGRGINALQKSFDNIKFRNIDMLDQKLQSIERSLTSISSRRADMDSIFNINSVDGGSVAPTQRSRVVTAANPDGGGDNTLDSIYSLLLQWYERTAAGGGGGWASDIPGEGPGRNNINAREMERAASAGGGNIFTNFFGRFTR
jgi:hypothetical protein